MNEETMRVIDHLRILTDYAYYKGFHELGYDPVEFVQTALTAATQRAERAEEVVTELNARIEVYGEGEV